jgi:transposase
LSRRAELKDMEGIVLAAVRSVVNTGVRQGLTAYQAITKALSSHASLFNPS